MRKRVCLALLLAGQSAPEAVQAQGWAAGLVFGADKYDLDDLDVLMVARGFGPLDSSKMATGFSLHSFRRRWLPMAVGWARRLAR